VASVIDDKMRCPHCGVVLGQRWEVHAIYCDVHTEGHRCQECDRGMIAQLRVIPADDEGSKNES
jgi:DNA-directed RNA polymerase subunit RPC12/RpoP